jgi:ATP-binding cassette, subfamily B, bacterial MsbA
LSQEVARVWLEMKVHKARLIIVALSGLFVAFVGVAFANLQKGVFDGLQQGNINLVKDSFGLIIALSIFGGIARYIHLFNMNMVSELVAQSFRQKLQMKLMSLNLSFHNSFATGSGGLISRVMNDIMVLYNGLRLFADLFREPWLAIGLIGTLFYRNWRITTFIIVVLPLVILLLRQMSFSIKKYGLKGQEELEKITGTIKESLDGVRIIQSFNLETEMANKFKEQTNEFLLARKRLHRLIEVTGPITENIMIGVTFSIIIYMTTEIAKGQATLGDAISYFAALLMLNVPIKKIQESYVRVQETIVSIQRALMILDEANEVPQSQSTKKFPSGWKKIDYRNVSFKYGENWVLKNINLTIHRGEVVAFVGGSGSGKSTLVNLLERFFDPTDGQIFIDDIPIDHIQLKELRHNIALVTQDVFLFSDTIEKNIWAGDFSKPRQGIEVAARAANSSNFIARIKNAYQSKVGDRGNLLSGGEKQRISIARAIFKDAPILILDEATSALDSQSEQEVQKGLDTLMEGRTALVIAHRLSTVSRADRIFVMKNGQIVEQGQHQELISKKGEYAHLYELQNSY